MLKRSIFIVIAAQSLIASTTKLMTAIVAIENCGLDDELEVGADSCGIEGSSMYLHPGQCVTVEDLFAYYHVELEPNHHYAYAVK